MNLCFVFASHPKKNCLAPSLKSVYETYCIFIPILNGQYVHSIFPYDSGMMYRETMDVFLFTAEPESCCDEGKCCRKAKRLIRSERPQETRGRRRRNRYHASFSRRFDAGSSFGTAIVCTVRIRCQNDPDRCRWFVHY